MVDLLELQKLDSEILAATAEIDAGPAAVEGVEARARAEEEKFEKLREGLVGAQKDRRTLEGELDLIRARFSKYQSQLMEVKTNNAYKAMLHEIEGTKKEIAGHEEQILEKMLLADDLEQSLQGDEQQHKQLLAGFATEKAELDRKGAAAESRRAELQSRRGGISGRVEPGVLGRYEKVAGARGGIGLAAAREELCMGCRVKLRPQAVQEIRTGTGLQQCDSCGRFLYFVDGPVKEPVEGARPATTQEPTPGEPAP